MDEFQRLQQEFYAALEEARTVAEELRDEAVVLTAELAAEREQMATERGEEQQREAEESRKGDHGRARQQVQQRIDRGETTWRDVMSGRDQDWSAVQVREQVVGNARAAIDQLEVSDPDFAREYRRGATLRRGQEPGEWT